MTRGFVPLDADEDTDEDEFEMPESLDVCLLKTGYAVLATDCTIEDHYIAFEQSIVVSRDTVVKHGTLSLLHDIIFKEYEANAGDIHESYLYIPLADVEFLYGNIPDPDADNEEE